LYNGVFVDTTNSIRKLLATVFIGLDRKYLLFFLKRFENNIDTPIRQLDLTTQIYFFSLINGLIPKNGSLSNVLLINIIFLDITYSYKGWRHFFGLPVNGQRT
jgi:ribosomal protein S13